MSESAWRIDVHHHVLPPKYQPTTPMPVQVPNLDEQLERMEAFHIRAALTSLTPRILDAHPGRLIEVARDCNDFQAELAGREPHTLGAFALLPLPDVDASLRETAYALDQLRLDGVGLYSSWRGRYLGDPQFDPVMGELDRRGATVFVHPAHACAPAEAGLGAPDGTIEYIFDSARGIVNCLWQGTFVRFPNIRWIFSHGGSAVPYLVHRLARMESGGTVKDVRRTLRGLLYDITSAMDRHALRSLQELAPIDHILWGTDMPFVQGEALREEIEHEWERYDGFDQAARAAIEHGNAERLFSRFRR
ncbi:MAG: amidohydrolase [Chloroflexi bacterium]|nr:amidohydrolase [Chloroflexota bacterium]